LVRELELARLYGRKSNNGFLQSGSEAVVDHPKYKEYMELFGGEGYAQSLLLSHSYSVTLTQSLLLSHSYSVTLTQSVKPLSLRMRFVHVPVSSYSVQKRQW